jgi:protein-S-isoprenylcysteine O-methyltransferase Ste14
MKGKLFKNIIKVVMITFIMVPVLSLALSMPAFAQLNETNIGVPYAENLGLGNKDPRDMAVSIIQVVLGFLAIIVVLLILYGGFVWMTAGGNEDKVATGKKIITAGVVGLIIILAAWGIARFVVTVILNATQ